MVKKKLSEGQVLQKILNVAIKPHAACSECGKVAELRPYGKNGASICFSCGMKDKETTEKQFMKYLEK